MTSYNILLIGILSIGLNAVLGCGNVKPSTDHSNFEVLPLEYVSSETTKADSTTGIAEEKVFNLKACLRDRGSGQPIIGQNFAVRNPHGDTAVKTNSLGCFFWSEKLSLGNLQTDNFLKLQRWVLGLSPYSGSEELNIGLNPSKDGTASFADLRFGDYKNIVPEVSETATPPSDGTAISISDLSAHYEGRAGVIVDRGLNLYVKHRYLFKINASILRTQASSQISRPEPIAQGRLQLTAYLVSPEGQILGQTEAATDFINGIATTEVTFTLSAKKQIYFRTRDTLYLKLAPAGQNISLKPAVISTPFTPIADQQSVGVQPVAEDLTKLLRSLHQVDPLPERVSQYAAFQDVPGTYYLPQSVFQKKGLTEDDRRDLLVDSLADSSLKKLCSLFHAPPSGSTSWYKEKSPYEKCVTSPHDFISVTHNQLVENVLGEAQAAGVPLGDIQIQASFFKDYLNGEESFEGNSSRVFFDGSIQPSFGAGYFGGGVAHDRFVVHQYTQRKSLRSRVSAIQTIIFNTEELDVRVPLETRPCVILRAKDSENTHYYCGSSTEKNQYSDSWFLITLSQTHAPHFLLDDGSSTDLRLSKVIRGREKFEQAKKFLESSVRDFALEPDPKFQDDNQVIRNWVSSINED